MTAAVQVQQQRAPDGAVTQAIRAASRATGIPFDYLLRTAERESSLDPNARARTSTASGLFQFIDQTWLQTMRDEGARLGFAREAQAIERLPNGRLTVQDPAERRRIMDMRFDANVNAVMAGAFTQRNQEVLTQALGRTPNAGELYVAHFLGAQGASRFLTQAERTPEARAADAFPDAAGANRTIFFNRDGTARTFAEVRDRLVAQHRQVPAVVAAAQAGLEMRGIPLPAGQQQGQQQQGQQQTGPVFHSLFRPDARGPVSSLVQGLWGRNAQVAAFAPQQAGQRQPFFPTSVLRVGEVAAPRETAALTETPAPAAVDAPAPVTVVTPPPPAAAIREAVPLPLPRPEIGTPQREGERGEGAPERVEGRRRTRGTGRPMDLLSFVRTGATR